jgi:hypothetical protein
MKKIIDYLLEVSTNAVLTQALRWNRWQYHRTQEKHIADLKNFSSELAKLREEIYELKCQIEILEEYNNNKNNG